MTQSEFFAWNMEQDPILRSTIVAVVVLDTTPDWERFVTMMDRATHVVPNFRHRPVRARWGIAPPHWVVDPDFDLSWHVRRLALPAPADLDAVLDVARRSAMEAFDTKHPLWHFTLLSGLGDGRAALVLKVHHSLTDGLGGVEIAGEIVDFARGGTDRGPLPDAPRPTEVSALSDTAEWVAETAADLARKGTRTLASALRRAFGSPLRTVLDAGTTCAAVVRFARPVPNTLSPIMTARGLRRRLAAIDVPLEDLHTASRHAGVSVNAAFLAALMLGMRKYHERHRASVERLRVTVPVSLRTESDRLGGNRITLVRLALPVNPADDPVELMRRIGGIVETSRRDPAVPLSNAIAGALNLLPTGYLASVFEHVDVLASNVPGSPIPMFLAGAEIERYYVFGPTLGTALDATLMSHAGTCCVGITADSASVPDLPVMTECLEDGFRAVLASAAPDLTPS
ncbi:wax ester/triacylglycerol synthase domain-containing protein [Prescottella soli]|uniref:diacylglycerol O-acyltransferase n=1 Tax=Prescottella soli TaxID=1543852 RepID=A0ABW9G0E3_9NOCA